jgi:hypothetical protein
MRYCRGSGMGVLKSRGSELLTAEPCAVGLCVGEQGAPGSTDSQRLQPPRRRRRGACYSSNNSSSSSSMVGSFGSQSPAGWRPSLQGLAAPRTAAPGGAGAAVAAAAAAALAASLSTCRCRRRAGASSWRPSSRPGLRRCRWRNTSRCASCSACALPAGTAVYVLHICRTQVLCSQRSSEFSRSTLPPAMWPVLYVAAHVDVHLSSSRLSHIAAAIAAFQPISCSASDRQV